MHFYEPLQSLLYIIKEKTYPSFSLFSFDWYVYQSIFILTLTFLLLPQILNGRIEHAQHLSKVSLLKDLPQHPHLIHILV